MIEMDLFKESYFLGKLLWVKGPEGARKVRVTYEMLKICGVLDAQVAQLDGSQLVDIFAKGIPKKTLSHYRVLMVRDFEKLSGLRWERFMDILAQYRFLQFELGVRIILISNEESGMPESVQHKELYRCKPLIIQLSDMAHSVEDADAKIHDLIEIAAQVAGKPVVRLTEKAANFLEIMPFLGNEDELIGILVQAIQKSKNGVLKWSDLSFVNSL